MHRKWPVGGWGVGYLLLRLQEKECACVCAIGVGLPMSFRGWEWVGFFLLRTPFKYSALSMYCSIYEAYNKNTHTHTHMHV